jgi:hypothetical protein
VARLPVAIDPRGCSCTECLTGEYVPLDRATDAQIMAVLLGYVRNNTELDEDELADVLADG